MQIIYNERVNKMRTLIIVGLVGLGVTLTACDPNNDVRRMKRSSRRSLRLKNQPILLRQKG